MTSTQFDPSSEEVAPRRLSARRDPRRACAAARRSTATALVLSVLIPVYNERNTIELILNQVHAVPVRKEIICVNDFSTDGTKEILDRLHAEGRIHG